MDERQTDGLAGARAPSDAAKRIRRVTGVSIVLNLALAAIKFSAGIMGRSQTLVADAVHSLSDLVTDLAVLVGVRYWTRPPDETHPYGHRRIETLITTMIGAALGLVAVRIGYQALQELRDPHGGGSAGLTGLPLAAAALSIVSKEAIYRWTASVGRQCGSAAVVANAWHHRTDALSSIPAALAVGVAWLRPEWGVVDHVGAFVMSLFILHAAWLIAWPALRELTDAGVTRADAQWIRRTVMETKGVRDVHAVRTRYVGSRVQVDLHVLVDGELSVRAGHDISERVKQHLLRQGPSVCDVVVHLEPFANG